MHNLNWIEVVCELDCRSVAVVYELDNLASILHKSQEISKVNNYFRNAFSSIHNKLILSWGKLLSFRNQSTDF